MAERLRARTFGPQVGHGEASGLRREPHAFEGFGSGAGHPRGRDLAVAEGERLEVVEVDIDPAAFATVALMDLDHDVVPVVLRNKLHKFERLPRVQPTLQNSRMPSWPL